MTALQCQNQQRGRSMLLTPGLCTTTWIESANEREVCGVCSMHRRAVDVVSHNITSIPNLELLNSAAPRTEAHPRNALTTYQYTDLATMETKVFCLQPHSCAEDDDGAVIVAVCKSCHHHLANGRVPPESLVCFDAGMNIYIEGLCIMSMYWCYLLIRNYFCRKHP